MLNKSSVKLLNLVMSRLIEGYKIIIKKFYNKIQQLMP